MLIESVQTILKEFEHRNTFKIELAGIVHSCYISFVTKI